MLNIKAIEYLIDYFYASINLMGKSATAVEMFKKNTEQLEKIGQLGTHERYVVMDTCGMLGTNNLKWDISLANLEVYKQKLKAYEKYGFDTDKILNEIKQEDISQKMKGILYNTYAIDGVSRINKAISMQASKKVETKKTVETKKPISSRPVYTPPSNMSNGACASGFSYTYHSLRC